MLFQFYYLFGFLFLVFIILVVSCSQISIVMVYFQLCSENYHWWWRSFAVSGGSAVYVFAYSIFYFYTKLDINDFVPSVIYFIYTVIITITLCLVTGTIGFFATFFFIWKFIWKISGQPKHIFSQNTETEIKLSEKTKFWPKTENSA